MTYAEVMMLPSGRSKGMGVVEFVSSSLAKKAISESYRHVLICLHSLSTLGEFNGQTLGGRVIEITEDKFERK